MDPAQRRRNTVLDRSRTAGHTAGMPWLSIPFSILLVALLSALVGAGTCYELLCRRRLRKNEDTVRRQRAELQAMTRRIITLQEDERSALSRELHDDIGQAITAIKLSAQALDDEDDARRAATIAEISAIADQTVVKLRNLSLLLRPPQLDALGLEAALRWQAGALFRTGTPHLSLSLEPLPRRPPAAVELACFRIAQEALTNVLRHANANEVQVTLDTDQDIVELHVEDDGRGFDARQTHGLGLVTMRERAEQLGGTLEVRRGDGGGTCVRARLPMGAADV